MVKMCWIRMVYGRGSLPMKSSFPAVFSLVKKEASMKVYNEHEERHSSKKAAKKVLQGHRLRNEVSCAAGSSLPPAVKVLETRRLKSG